jgi:uncharacterized membrane protein YraQ (UPF0718 family)
MGIATSTGMQFAKYGLPLTGVFITVLLAGITALWIRLQKLQSTQQFKIESHAKEIKELNQQYITRIEKMYHEQLEIYKQNEIRFQTLNDDSIQTLRAFTSAVQELKQVIVRYFIATPDDGE